MSGVSTVVYWLTPGAYLRRHPFEPEKLKRFLVDRSQI
jgi:hypothetical protein